MKFKFYLPILILLFSVNAFALLKIPEGVFVLDGKILVQQGNVYLAINYKTNAESRIKLLGRVPNELLSQIGSNASIKIKVTKSFYSLWGEAEFVEFVKYIDPFEAPVVYNDERGLPKK